MVDRTRIIVSPWEIFFDYDDYAFDNAWYYGITYFDWTCSFSWRRRRSLPNLSTEGGPDLHTSDAYEI